MKIFSSIFCFTVLCVFSGISTLNAKICPQSPCILPANASCAVVLTYVLTAPISATNDPDDEWLVATYTVENCYSYGVDVLKTTPNVSYTKSKSLAYSESTTTTYHGELESAVKIPLIGEANARIGSSYSVTEVDANESWTTITTSVPVAFSVPRYQRHKVQLFLTKKRSTFDGGAQFHSSFFEGTTTNINSVTCYNYEAQSVGSTTFSNPTVVGLPIEYCFQ